MSTEKPYDRGYPIPFDDETLVITLLNDPKENLDTEELTGKEIALFNSWPSHLGGIAARKALRIIDCLKSTNAELSRNVISADAGRDAAFDLIVEAHNERDAAHMSLELAKTEISELLAQRHALESENIAGTKRSDAMELSKKEALDEANERWRLDFGAIGRLETECATFKGLASVAVREFDRLKCGEPISSEFIEAMCELGKWVIAHK
jgi:hypothetical protein